MLPQRLSALRWLLARLKEVARIPGVPVPEDGYVIPSDAPGFGMEIREEWITPWDHTRAEGERVAVL